MSVTFAYITARKDCRFEWCWDALQKQGVGTASTDRIIVVDFYDGQRAMLPDLEYITTPEIMCRIGDDAFLRVVKPMPSVWYGDSRLTKENWFDASSFRNTALCHCNTSHVCFIDDLSVPLPGFVDRVRAASHGRNMITLGAYQKVKDLVVEKGEIKSFTPFPGGRDSRLGHGNKMRGAKGSELFGCSLVAPVEALLDIDGWPSSLCGSLGFEDCLTGCALSNNGCSFLYDPAMMTYESEELHHVGEKFRKEDWHFENGNPVVGGNGGSDMSHAALNIALASKRFDNGFEGGIRALRQHMLNGGKWPEYLGKNPVHHWFTKQPLSEM